MERNTNFLSELEADFQSELELETDSEFESDNEFELDNEQDDEFEMESDNEFELDHESDDEFEMEMESDNEFEYDSGNGRNFESRIQQLLSRDNNNEMEFDQELNSVLYEMEQEFFFKGLKRLARKGLRKFKSIAGRMPLNQIVNAASSLARGNIRNALRRAAALALRHGAGFVPGGNLMGPLASRALNLEMETDHESIPQKARNLVQLARQSYKHLAQQLDPRMAQPKIANTLAANAIKNALSLTRKMAQHASKQQRRNYVVIQLSPAAWRKIRRGSNLIIKVRNG